MSEKIRISGRCPICGAKCHVNVDEDKYVRYQFGNDYIQDVFPEMSAFGREFLKTGYCTDCQTMLFGIDDPKAIEASEIVNDDLVGLN